MPTKKKKPGKPGAKKCSARSRQTKKPCRQYAIAGGDVCRFHGGSAPQVVRKAKERIEASKERVLLEFCRLGMVDMRDLFDAKDKLKPFQKLDKDTAAAVAGVTFHSFGGGVKSIKLADKTASLNSIARHLGMFEKDNLQGNKYDAANPLTVRLTFVDGPTGAVSDVVAAPKPAKPSKFRIVPTD